VSESTDLYSIDLRTHTDPDPNATNYPIKYSDTIKQIFVRLKSSGKAIIQLAKKVDADQSQWLTPYNGEIGKFFIQFTSLVNVEIFVSKEFNEYIRVPELKGIDLIKLHCKILGQIVEPTKCPPGQHKDPTTGICVPDIPPPCPPGQHRDDSGICVPDVPPPCPDGQHRDPATGQCVPDTKPIVPLTVAMVGDTKAGSDAKKTFASIKRENPDIFEFVGDTSYVDDDGKIWNQAVEAADLKSIIHMSKGNHEDDEEDADACGKDHEEWLPELKTRNWLTSKHVKNGYFISMNSQDLDYQFAERDQARWVREELNKAVNLRSEGKVDWIFVMVHKPQYTLKTKHPPELKARDVYQPMFDAAQVDFQLSGHNHDSQLWRPIAYGAKPLPTELPDGPYDFSNPHGQFIVINGAGGRALTPIKPEEFDSNGHIKNPNVLFAQFQTFSYTMFYIEGKKCTLQYKSNSGQILHEVKITKDGGIIEPPIVDARLKEPIGKAKVGQIFVIDGSQSSGNITSWSIIQDTTDVTKVTLLDIPGKPFSKQFTFPDTDETLDFILEVKDAISGKSDIDRMTVVKESRGPAGDIDEFGMKLLHKITGNKVDMKKGKNHRNGQRYNVNHKFQNYLVQGYFRTGAGQKKIEHKTDGPNHGGCKKLPECMWYELGFVIATGKSELQTEWPHPTNRPVDDSKVEFLKNLDTSFAEQWMGYAIAVYDTPQGRTMEQWIEKDPFDANGKPKNNWVLTLKAVEKGQIFPSQHIPRKLPVDFDEGLESEIRMHKATNGDTEMKWVRVFEIIPPSS
jgi:hypothetical protein